MWRVLNVTQIKTNLKILSNKIFHKSFYLFTDHWKSIENQNLFHCGIQIELNTDTDSNIEPEILFECFIRSSISMNYLGVI